MHRWEVEPFADGYLSSFGKSLKDYLKQEKTPWSPCECAADL